MQEIEKAGGKAKAVELDVSADQESIKRSVDEAWAAFGKLDILVRKPLRHLSGRQFRFCCLLLVNAVCILRYKA